MAERAERTTIYQNPAGGDGAGILVAAGDEVPAGLGLIQNTPNKVDAAANHETADAADQAQHPTPAGPFPAVPALQSGSPEAERLAREALERTTANRAEYDAQTAERLAAAAEPMPTGADRPAAAPPETTAEPRGRPADMTVAELDAAYGDQDGYPSSGNKADKVAFAEGG